MHGLPRRVMATAVAVAAACMVVASCSSGSTSAPAAGGTAAKAGQTPGAAGTEPAAPVAQPTEAPLAPTPKLSVPSGALPFDKPVRIGVSNGTVVSASVKTKAGTTELAGKPDGDQHWVSETTPLPGESYSVVATVADLTGGQHQVQGSFDVAKVDDSRRLTLDVTPNKGDIVGIGAPITVQFDQEVTDRKAVEAAFRVYSSPRVSGAWHWLGSRQVQFRPRNLWRSGTTVRAVLDLNGVKAGKDLWGGRRYDVKFRVGTARTAVVDASRHTFTVWEAGKPKATWPTSLGRPEFATRNGTYIILGKYPTLTMTSCSVNIACNPSDPNYYKLRVDWDVRITNSGAFVHAAPWSTGAQGSANVSHGCINLSTDRGRLFYHNSKYGDIVKVRHSSRGHNDLVQAGDPGMVNWNQTWWEWKKGSALGRAIVTEAFPSSA